MRGCAGCAESSAAFHFAPAHVRRSLASGQGALMRTSPACPATVCTQHHPHTYLPATAGVIQRELARQHRGWRTPSGGPPDTTLELCPETMRVETSSLHPGLSLHPGPTGGEGRAEVYCPDFKRAEGAESALTHNGILITLTAVALTHSPVQVNLCTSDVAHVGLSLTLQGSRA